MPLLLLLLLLVPALLLFMVVLVPFGVRRRYRSGIRRRLVRRRFVAFNLFGFSVSAMMLVVSSAITAIWDPRALAAVALGMVIGALVAGLGLWLADWDDDLDSRDRWQLYVTPNRWIVTLVYVVVVSRILYSLWRTLALIARRTSEESLVVEAGVAGSLAAGAFFLAYHLAFWAGAGLYLSRARRATKS